MPSKFHFGRDKRSHEPVGFIQHQTLPEQVDVMHLLRSLHATFPDEYTQIGQELLVPEGKKLFLDGYLPGNLPHAN